MIDGGASVVVWAVSRCTALHRPGWEVPPQSQKSKKSTAQLSVLPETAGATGDSDAARKQRNPCQHICLSIF